MRSPARATDSELRAHARRPLGRHGLGRWRARRGGTCRPASKTRTLDDRRPAIRRSRSARMAARAAVGLDDGIQLVDLRTSATCEHRDRRPRVEPASGCSSARTARRIVSTNLDGTVTALGRRHRRLPRETLRGHSDAVLQPVFSPDGGTLYTVSADGSAIAWDLAGDRRLRAAVHVHARPRVRRLADTHPGRFSPDGRLIAVGLKEHGVGAPGREDARPRSARRCSRPAARSRRSRSRRTAGRWLPRPDAATLTVWDVATRARCGTEPFRRLRYAVAGPQHQRRTGRRSRPAGVDGVDALGRRHRRARSAAIGDGARRLGDLAFSPTGTLARVRRGEGHGGP